MTETKFRTSTCCRCLKEFECGRRGVKRLVCQVCVRAEREWKRANKPPAPTSGKGRSYRFLVDHKDYKSRVCLIWPYNRDDKGYGTLGYKGKIYKAHRLMCVMAHGVPQAGYQASHSCGRGHEGCVNPVHLAWKTNSQNQIERYRTHGRGMKKYYGRYGKLTDAQKRELLKGCLTMKVSEAVAKFGIKRGTVDYWGRKAKDALLVTSD